MTTTAESAAANRGALVNIPFRYIMVTPKPSRMNISERSESPLTRLRRDSRTALATWA